MAVIVTRAGKGSPLTNTEVDQNFINLNAAVVAAPGDVVGPAGATDNFLVRFDGVTGKLLQNSNWVIGDDGHILPSVSLASDIGSSSARVRTIFAQTISTLGGIFTGDTSVLATGVQVASVGFGPFVDLVRYNGTAAAPTAVKQWDMLGALTGKGRGATGWTAATVALYMEAAEDWTDAAQGAHLNIQTTPKGTNAITNIWQFATTGNILPFVDKAFDIGASGQRVNNIWANAGVFSGPVSAGPMVMQPGTTNTILYFDNTPATNAALLYDKAKNQYQFFGPSPQVFINGADGSLISNGGILAVSVSAGPSGMVALGGAPGVNSVIYFDSVTPNKLGAFVYQFPGTTLDLILGGVHVAMFNPADKSLTVDGGVYAGAVTAAAAGLGYGYINLNPGSPTNSGYVGFFSPSNTRVGYIGFADTTNNYINVTAENGYNYKFNDPVRFMAEITFGVSSDLVEPRGRYWARPAPSTNYTLGLADAGTLVVQVATAPNTITIPPQSVVAWKNWTRIDVVQYGSAQITFAPGAGVSLQSAGGKRKTTGLYSVASLIQINQDEWLLVGDLVT